MLRKLLISYEVHSDATIMYLEKGDIMERRDYHWRLDYDAEQSFTVTALDHRYTFASHQSKKRYLPMKMYVVTNLRNGYEIGLAGLVYPLPQNDEDESHSEEFLQNWLQIFRGENPDWILTEFQVLMTGVCLGYYNRELGGDIENLYISISQQKPKDVLTKPIAAKMHLRFSVPHADERPDTMYELLVEYSRQKPDGDRFDHFVQLKRYNCRNQATMYFTVDDYEKFTLYAEEGWIIEPKDGDITEYIDY